MLNIELVGLNNVAVCVK